MIQVRDLSYSTGTRRLFENVSFSTSPDSRIGLVGANGLGKSSLLRIIVGESKPSSGRVYLSKNIKIGYLPQQIPEDIQEFTLEDFLFFGTEMVGPWRIAKEVEKGSHIAESTYLNAIEFLVENGGYANLSKFEGYIRSEFEGREPKDVFLKELSAGEQRLAYLFKFDIVGYDFWLLDEPTNFLDLKNLRRIYRLLEQSQHPFLVVSHDRYVLRNFCSRIMEIQPTGIMAYTGNYDDFLVQREMNKEAIERKNSVIVRTIKRLEKASARLLQVGAQKDIPSLCKKGQVIRGQVKRLSETMKEEVQDSTKPNIFFRESDKSSKKVIDIDGLIKIFGDRFIFEGAKAEIRAGEKIGLVGYNGAGKSTLLKILLGFDHDFDGKAALGPSVFPGYFDPHAEHFSFQDTIERVVLHGVPQINKPQVYGVMRSAGIKADPSRPLSSLSGGELSRLQLAMIAKCTTNLLLLDEPTNHLDLVAIESLEESLAAYSGTVIVISHDFYFLDNVVDSYLLVKDGKLRDIGKISDEVFLELSL